MRRPRSQRVHVLPAQRLAPVAVARFLPAAEVRPEDVVYEKVRGSVGLLRGLVGQNHGRGWEVRRQGHALLLGRVPAAVGLLLLFHSWEMSALSAPKLHLLLALPPPFGIQFRRTACKNKLFAGVRTNKLPVFILNSTYSGDMSSPKSLPRPGIATSSTLEPVSLPLPGAA